MASPAKTNVVSSSAKRVKGLNPIKVWQPHPVQVDPFNDISLVILLTGTVGSGKSMCLLQKYHACALKYPGANVLLVRKAKESLVNSTVLTFWSSVVGNDPHVNHAISKSRFEYSNGSKVLYGGMLGEKQRSQVRSIGEEGGLDFVFMEEATEFEEGDFNELIGRLRGRAAPWRQVGLCCNPDAPTHWIKRRLIDGRGARVYHLHTRDNPSLPDTYVATLDMMTGVQRLRLTEGKWAQATGAVYKMWESSRHIVEAFPIPQEWRKIRVVDFGYNNPCTVQWWAESPDGDIYLYRQIYRSKTLITDIADQILALDSGEDIEATVCDHDAMERALLDEKGIRTMPAQKDIALGIQTVEARLRGTTLEQVRDDMALHDVHDDEYVPPIYEPTLFVMAESLHERDPLLESAHLPTDLEEEIVGYVYPPASRSTGEREVPMKRNDHAMDAMRYACMYFSWRPHDNLEPIPPESIMP